MGRLTPSRERITTIRDDGSRFFLHPADTRGRFTLARRLVALLLIAVYVALPWIPVNGQPAIFLDVLNRRFHIFGATFAAQDLWIAFFFISGLGFSLFVLTALFGRLWCGWACPHTVFLEHVYRRIERWFEGDSTARQLLDRAPWSAEKALRRGSKHLIFILISALIAHLFLSYFISLPELYRYITSNPREHWGAFLFMAAATSILYFNFAWFREQLCLIICPYGRLQSALIDDDTLVIGYDENRGEPRGPATRKDIGDCIDCNRCVQVCPTGIDIRQGLQIECVGCANCVDACDEIMDRVNRPRGLIRYDSMNGLASQPRRWLRPRLFLYLALMLLGAAVATFSVTRLSPAYMGIARIPGAPYIIDEDRVRNQFNLRLVNKRQTPMTFTVEAANELGEPLVLHGFEQAHTIAAMAEESRPMVISVSHEQYSGPFTVNVRVTGQPGGVELTRSARFLGPSAEHLAGRRQSDANPTTP